MFCCLLTLILFNNSSDYIVIRQFDLFIPYILCCIMAIHLCSTDQKEAVVFPISDPQHLWIKGPGRLLHHKNPLRLICLLGAHLTPYLNLPHPMASFLLHQNRHHIQGHQSQARVPTVIITPHQVQCQC